ncbi:MAG: cobamide remodeling phosphodiesterase CbiR [Anaerolineae bacterium]|nr:sugar phosphate isomerase/epimerase [Anaerolineae bacterium]MDW8102581.1 cobamide remodeling phosphodiesterase CbiR [Anaerolineae bacterium]
MRFRLGSTSYVYPADILPNVQRLAGLVDDIELVFFEVEDTSNLPDADTVAKLRKIARKHGVSYTVHLPTDLRLGAEGEEWESSVNKACKVIRSVRSLEPWAYIVHLYPDMTGSFIEWQERCVKALEVLANEAGKPEILAIENLENCPLECLVPILKQTSVSLCLDIGHLWLAGVNPLPVLKVHLGRTRVLHLHGVAQRDHLSLSCVPPASLRAILRELILQGYRGVVTVEVFSAEDFFPSLKLILSLLKGMKGRK